MRARAAASSRPRWPDHAAPESSSVRRVQAKATATLGCVTARSSSSVRNGMSSSVRALWMKTMSGVVLLSESVAARSIDITGVMPLPAEINRSLVAALSM
ncbi:Uncharacterised protein [Mycobacteroides abscessus subsp. abscessus]|nr:Uncharacterised protein [Mycobacteroides abscessus subsp. abscessus]